jgi:hypothetical protein
MTDATAARAAAVAAAVAALTAILCTLAALDLAAPTIVPFLLRYFLALEISFRRGLRAKRTPSSMNYARQKKGPGDGVTNPALTTAYSGGLKGRVPANNVCGVSPFLFSQFGQTCPIADPVEYK